VKSCYVDYPTRAIADLCDYYGRGMIITRINVPAAHRNNGVGSMLLQQILTDADAEGIKLWLEIQASDGLTRDQLQEWYERHGFEEVVTGVWRRKPVKETK
jgi:ribosomal protein S18 acetylase RimI-like enzyme